MRVVIHRDEWDKHYYHAPQYDDQEKIINEPEDVESDKVATCLEELRSGGFISEIKYPVDQFHAFRKAVKETFFIFWTAINPPMERLLYALSAILKPKNILGLGIFTGYPVVWSLGPALQQIYPAEKLIGVEIDKNNARLGNDNIQVLIEEIHSPVKAEILGEDGFDVLERYGGGSIDLLYLDANGTNPESGVASKNINSAFLKKAYPKIKPGGWVICHNAYQPSFQTEAADYLSMTEDEKYFSMTATVGIDEMGIEFSIKKAA
jgi:predicted O-methyltransferase YrrM